jgi:hypothetical protein
MNLNSNPTIDDLKALFAAANDMDGHHCLWVAASGDVMLDCVPQGLNPVGFEKSQPSMKVRYETFQIGNGYVGPKAAQDDAFMQRLFSSLMEQQGNLPSGDRVSYIDYF